MVQLFEKRLKRALEIGEIHHPAGFRANISADVDFNAEGVAMHAGALVTRRDIGQPVCGFDLKYAKDIHARIVPPGRAARNNSRT